MDEGVIPEIKPVLDFVTALFILAIVTVVWRGFVTPRLTARRISRRRIEWPRNELERALTVIGTFDEAQSRFEQLFLKSELTVFGDAELKRPTTISADFDTTLLDSMQSPQATSGNSIALGPFVWCFSAPDRAVEFGGTILGAVAKQGSFAIPSTELLEFSRDNSATLMLNQFLEFGYHIDLSEIDRMLSPK